MIKRGAKIINCRQGSCPCTYVRGPLLLTDVSLTLLACITSSSRVSIGLRDDLRTDVQHAANDRYIVKRQTQSSPTGMSNNYVYSDCWCGSVRLSLPSRAVKKEGPETEPMG